MFSFLEEHQIQISDRFLSWGWYDENRPKITPFSSIKYSNSNMGYDQQGGALMVELIVPRYSYHLFSIPIASQWLEYFSNQKEFLRELPIELRKNVTLRLNQKDFGWEQTLRWKNEMPDVRVENGSEKEIKVIEKEFYEISVDSYLMFNVYSTFVCSNYNL